MTENQCVKNNIMCGIVLYNPDLNRLEQNIIALINQVEKLFLIDNGSGNLKNIKVLIKKNNWKLEIIELKENKGIAYALNVILLHAIKENYEWFLTLDQDSVASENLITVYKKYIGIKNLGILSCEINDRNFTEKHIYKKYEELDYVITSGSLVNTNICKEVNGFDYGMFIDFVDFDLCAKIREAGYRIIRTYEASLLHEVGHSTAKKIGKKQYVAYNHKPFRVYYFYRNGIYFINKHAGKGSINEFAWKKNLLRRFILITLYEKEKFKKYKMIVKGLKDSKHMPKTEKGLMEMKYE